jgi:hypothetical protein
MRTPEGNDNISSKTAQKAKQFLNIFSSYQGPQAAYFMEDLVALSLGRLDVLSQNGDLQSILEKDYPGWSQADFIELLEILCTNTYLKKLIDNARLCFEDDYND